MNKLNYLAFLILLLTSNILLANTFIVTTNANKGVGSLPQAIADANATPDVDTIKFEADYQIRLKNQLTINGNLTIDGTGQRITLNGQKNVRVFQIESGDVIFKNITITNGAAKDGNGGGVWIKTDATVTVNNCLITENKTMTGGDHQGGGIFNEGTLMVNNSTFSKNTVRKKGAGIFNLGTLTINNSTFLTNRASSREGVGGGIFNDNTGTLTLTNTIIAKSTNGDCHNQGTISTNLNNLIEDGSCNEGAIKLKTGNPRLVNVAQDNGGYTKTYALLANSPAIDAGDNATCEATDQRGEIRPLDGNGDNTATCDIGAFEAPLPNYTLTVKKTGNGTISGEGIQCGNDCSHDYINGTPVTLTAKPDANWQFDGFRGDCDDTGVLVMNSHKSCQVLFVREYTLTVKTTGNGTVTGEGIDCGEQCQTTVLNNTPVTLTAIPDTGFILKNWQGTSGCRGQKNTTTVTLKGNQTCTATFELACSKSNRLYVNQKANEQGSGCDWKDAFTDLQTALKWINSGNASKINEIWVATGTYKPTTEETDRSASFHLINGIAIYGGFAGTETQLKDRNSRQNPTILSGDIGTADDNSDNTYHVVIGSGTDATALLDGFMITGGQATEGTTCPNACGGGIFNDNGSPTLTHLVLQNNTAHLGGGIMNWRNSQPIIKQSFINNNIATDGAGMMNDDSNPIVSHVFLTDNSATNAGGGMFNNNHANPLLSHLNFTNNSANSGGGIYNDNSSPVVSHSILTNNTAINGAGITNTNDSQALLSNLILNNNTATQSGGAILNENSNSIVSQATLIGNSATNGSGIANINSSPVVNNSIFWNNEPSAPINDDADSHTTVNYSIVQNGWNGNGNHNKDQDPLFLKIVDEQAKHSTQIGGEDFHLKAGSPAIDAGHNDLIPLDLADAECAGGDGNTNEPVEIDFEGQTRRADGDGNGTDIVDMGAYETSPIILPSYRLTITNTGTGSGTVKSNTVGINCGNDCTQDYIQGSMVVLIANAKKDSIFTGWSGACNGTNNRVSLIMTEVTTCVADFDKPTHDIANWDAKRLSQQEPNVFSYITAQELSQISPAALSAIKPEQFAELKKETLLALTTEQFEQIPVTTLNGLTAKNLGGLSGDVIGKFTPAHLDALNPEQFQKMPSADMSKIFLNLDVKQVSPAHVTKLLPAKWEMDSETGALTAPVGAKLTLSTLPLPADLPVQVILPPVLDINSGFGLGGGGTPLKEGMRHSLDNANLTKFVLSQNEYGILLVEGTDELAGIKYTFIPDANNVIQVDTNKTPVGLTNRNGGFSYITMPTGQQFRVISAPQNPVALSETLGNGEVVLGELGDVLMELASQSRRGGARMVAIFDPFIEPAPEEWCVEMESGETICDFDNAPEHLRPGIHFPRARAGKLEQAKVVYSDGTAQVIRPTLLYPDTFIKQGLQYEGVDKLVFNANGTFYVSYQAKPFLIVPNFEVETKLLDEEQPYTPNIVNNNDGTLTYTIAVESQEQSLRRDRQGRAREVLIFDPFIYPVPEEWCVEMSSGEIICDFDNVPAL